MGVPPDTVSEKAIGGQGVGLKPDLRTLIPSVSYKTNSKTATPSKAKQYVLFYSLRDTINTGKKCSLTFKRPFKTEHTDVQIQLCALLN